MPRYWFLIERTGAMLPALPVAQLACCNQCRSVATRAQPGNTLWALVLAIPGTFPHNANHDGRRSTRIPAAHRAQFHARAKEKESDDDDHAGRAADHRA